MIDSTTEQVFPLAEAATFIPPSRGGRKTAFSTLLRWILTGVRAPSGERVRLEALRVGSRWMVSRESMQRFFEALTPRLDAEPLPAPRTQRQRARASERAAKELDRIGI